MYRAHCSVQSKKLGPKKTIILFVCRELIMHPRITTCMDTWLHEWAHESDLQQTYSTKIDEQINYSLQKWSQAEEKYIRAEQG